MALTEVWAAIGPALAGAVFGSGWWCWVDAVVCSVITVPFLHYLPGMYASPPPTLSVDALCLCYAVQNEDRCHSFPPFRPPWKALSCGFGPSNPAASCSRVNKFVTADFHGFRGRGRRIQFTLNSVQRWNECVSACHGLWNGWLVNFLAIGLLLLMKPYG